MRASTVAGFGTAPPNEPGVQVARRAAHVERDLDHAAHADADRDRVAAVDAGVAHDDDVAVAAASRCARSSSAKCSEPDSSSPSMISLRLTAGEVRPVVARCAASPTHVEVDLALVVDGAAADELLAVRGRAHERLQRRGLPQLDRVDRLHVVVAVERARSARRGRRSATRRRPRADPRSARSPRVGKPARSRRCASQSALRETSPA